MAERILAYTNKRVGVVTCEGRAFRGILRAVDSECNIVLASAAEYLYSSASGTDPADATQLMPLGLYMLRGDNVLTVSLIDTVAEAACVVATSRSPPLPAVCKA